MTLYARRKRLVDVALLDETGSAREVGGKGSAVDEELSANLASSLSLSDGVEQRGLSGTCTRGKRERRSASLLKALY